MRASMAAKPGRVSMWSAPLAQDSRRPLDSFISLRLGIPARPHQNAWAGFFESPGVSEEALRHLEGEGLPRSGRLKSLISFSFFELTSCTKLLISLLFPNLPGSSDESRRLGGLPQPGEQPSGRFRREAEPARKGIGKLCPADT
jgi:hypothetical protein